MLIIGVYQLDLFNKAKAFYDQNVNTSIAVSAAVGIGFFGVVVWGLKKTKIPAVRKLVGIFQGGK